MDHCSVFIYNDGDNAVYLHDSKEKAIDEIKGALDAMMSMYPAPAFNSCLTTVSDTQWRLHIEDVENGTEWSVIAAVARVYA